MSREEWVGGLIFYSSLGLVVLSQVWVFSWG